MRIMVKWRDRRGDRQSKVFAQAFEVVVFDDDGNNRRAVLTELGGVLFVRNDAGKALWNSLATKAEGPEGDR